MNQDWQIDQNLCKRCGACIDICPNRILQKNEVGQVFFRTDHLWMCFRCGHCMAICPIQAVQVPDLSYERDFYSQPELDGQENEQFAHLIAGRRAVRCFQDRPVPHELLEKVVTAIQSAPPGFRRPKQN